MGRPGFNLDSGDTGTFTKGRDPGPMVFTDFDGRVDVYGGFDGNLYQLTMWKWHGTDWKQLNLATVPSARSSSAVGVNFPPSRLFSMPGLEMLIRSTPGLMMVAIGRYNRLLLSR